MKIFENLDCETTIQDFGTNLLLICRAKEEGLQLMLNSLINFGAISMTKNNFGQVEETSIEFTDQNHLAAVFWTTQNRLEEYFRTIFWLRTNDKVLKTYKLNNHSSKKTKENPFWERCCQWAKEQVKILMENHSEVFINYYSKKKEGQTTPYQMGNISGSVIEPGDFKEAVLEHAFSPKE
jgi:hypothetical protein